jgi:hypothetical protein
VNGSTSADATAGLLRLLDKWRPARALGPHEVFQHRELQPEQICWLVLPPLIARILSDAAAPRTSCASCAGCSRSARGARRSAVPTSAG